MSALVSSFAHQLARRWKALALAALWLFAGTASCIWAWRLHGDPYVDATLARAGLRTHGPVTVLDRLARADGTPAWHVAYEFLDVGGTKFTGAVEITVPEHAKSLERSGNATIVYLRTNPRVSTLEGVKRSTMTEEQASALVAATAAAVVPLMWALLAAAWGTWRERAGEVPPSAISVDAQR